MVLLGHYDVVLLMGAPGAGKGTQARFVAEGLDVPHVASGDLLRDHRRRDTPLGRAAQVYMDRGDLVPDELVVDMIMDRLNQSDITHGALLDGFPRTVAQAEALDRGLAQRRGTVKSALYLEVPKAVLVDRLAGRWLCQVCGASYHELFNPAKRANACDVCDGELYQRTDDKREVVDNRIQVYLRDTLPVIDHYQQRGVMHTVNGGQEIEVVCDALYAALGIEAAEGVLSAA